jgi:hypothetical protein
MNVICCFRRPSRLWMGISLAVLFGVLVSSCAGTQTGAFLPDEGPAVPVSKQAASRLFEKVLSAVESAAQTQSVRFTLTDEEVTSALALGAQFVTFTPAGPVIQGLPGSQSAQGAPGLEGMGQPNANGGGNGAFSLTNFGLKIEKPQVRFTGDGRMILEGYGRVGSWRQPVRAVMAPRASDGELDLHFVKGRIGSLPLPAFIFNPIGKALASLILAGSDSLKIHEISIQQGSMTLSGEWVGGNPLQSLPSP